jgi:hypothetical protein
MTQDALLEVRKRFFNDFEFYGKHAVKIRTKEGAIYPLNLNKVQKRLWDEIQRQLRETGRVRIILLKARQQGLSTFASGFNYWWLSQHAASKGIVVAHVAESTKALFDMYRRIHSECPDMLKPSTRYSSRRELVFDKLDTALTVATAGGDGIARGETITHAHLSELAFWPNATANENLNAVLQAIPNTAGTSIIIESTANGMTGPYYEMWQGAVSGANGYHAFFSPWFESDEYREPAPADMELSPEEEDLKKKFDLDNDQLYWRRRKIAQNGRDLFMQEYPATPDEAFLASGRPVFVPEQLHDMIREAPPVLRKLALEGGEWHEHPRGELTVYRDHDPAETYYIGADIGMGIKGGDYSVAQILDGQKRQVAVWRGLVHPDYFADVLYALGNFYNEAIIAPENNNHGLLTAIRLGRDLAYPYVWTDVSEGKLNDQDSITIGFRTTVKTKPLIIDRLRAALREGEMKLYDKTTLREMLSFVVTESGKMEAESGCHDDTVMALAIANHIHEGSFTPIKVTDDFYLEAI